jgi:hypothetical protein
MDRLFKWIYLRVVCLMFAQTPLHFVTLQQSCLCSRMSRVVDLFLSLPLTLRILAGRDIL